MNTDKKLDIKNIYLGKATAENEKDDLHRYFLSTRAYLNAKDERKRKLFYIGYRGAGKSALFNQLTYEYSEKFENVIIQITPAEYAFDTFKKLHHDFHDIRAAYSIAWHYTLLIQVFIETSAYFDSHKNIKRNRENIGIINKYLLDNGFKNAQSKLEVFFEFLNRINVSKTKLNFVSKSFEKGASSNSKEYLNILSMKDIRQSIQALEYILVSHPIYIFIDELDTGWNNTEEAKNFINGLIYASQKLNSMKNISVFLSLRQDMYNNLADAYKDTEKIRDEIETIKWDKHLLTSLICNRISENQQVEAIFKGASYVSEEQLLNLVFEDNVFDYIIEQTLQRPREVIHFCNKAIEQYSETFIRRRLFGKRIDIETVKAIEEEISLDRFNDYCSEYDYEFPNIKVILNNFEGTSGIFTKDNFLKKLEQCILDFIDETNDLDTIKPYIENTEKLLIRLFEIAFVKISVTDENDFFAVYEKKPLNFRNVNYVQINTAFRLALKCTK